jgi:uncharacterized protein YceK
MSRRALAIFAMLSPWLCGCGTVYDGVAGPLTDQIYYRGVTFDVGCAIGGNPLAVADLPLSLVADTVMVPSLAYRQRINPRPSTFLVPEVTHRDSDKNDGDSSPLAISAR